MSRIEVFHLGVYRAREIRRDFIEFDHRSISNGIKDAVVNRTHKIVFGLPLSYTTIAGLLQSLRESYTLYGVQF